MSKYIVDIHGDIEGDYEIIKKYEEQQPCEDTISGQAAIDFESGKKVIEHLKQMPSAQPRIREKRRRRNKMSLSVKWIPCSERLPKKSGKYLCTFGGTNVIGIDSYTTEAYAKRWFSEPEEYIGWGSNNVVAWMPLLEPYTEAKETE